MRGNKHFIRLITTICLPILWISVCYGCKQSEVLTESPKESEVKSVKDELGAPFAGNSSSRLNIQDNGSHCLISIPDNIINQVESCSLSVVGHGDDGYLLLIYDREEDILENGTILVSKDQPVLTMLKSDIEQSILVPDVKEELN